jgi:hypothetical protein
MARRFRDTLDDDDGVIDGDELGGVESPAGPAGGGPWWSAGAGIVGSSDLIAA